MATPGKVTKKQRKRQVQAKTSLNSPYSLQWSPLPQEDMQFIMSALRCALAAIALAKREVKVPRRWGKRRDKRKERDASVDQFKPVPQEDTEARVAAPEKGGWTNASARRQLAIGVNEVTKALERNELRLVLVCKSAKPPHVTRHLLELSRTRGVPACQVPRLSAGVADALGLKSVLALGFRRNHGDGGRQAEEGTCFFSDAVDRIIPRVPRVRVAWVTGAEPRDAEVRPADEVTGEVRGEVKGHKRKIDDVSPEPSVESDPCAFQPLKVKKIIPNPSKIRKPKIKKESLK